MGVDVLPWQNDHMNYYTALQLTDDFYKLYYNNNYNFTIDCWGVHHPGLIGGLDGRLARRRGTWADVSVVGDRIIKTYINNKLNWQ
jgi:hypothetical protein